MDSDGELVCKMYWRCQHQAESLGASPLEEGTLTFYKRPQISDSLHPSNVTTGDPQQSPQHMWLETSSERTVGLLFPDLKARNKPGKKNMGENWNNQLVELD